jgi:hypothetical protein
MSKASKPLRTAAAIIEDSLRPFCPWEMNRHRQSAALDAAIKEARLHLDGALQCAGHAFDAELGTVANDLADRANTEAGKRLAGLLAVKDVLSSCTELPSIRQTLDPIFAELAEAQKREAEELAAKVADDRATAERKRIATEKAIAQVEAAFA